MPRLSRIDVARSHRGLLETPQGLARQLVNAAFAEVSPGRPLRVLDPCVGFGNILDEVAVRWPTASLVGVDIDPHAVAVARARCPQAQISCGNAFSLTERADLIICHPPFGMEWLGDFVYQCRGLLLPGGVLAMILPAHRARHTSGTVTPLPADTFYGTRVNTIMVVERRED